MTARLPRAVTIERAWRNTTEAQREAGRQWYHDAHQIAVDLDPDNPRRAAGVIAALSAQMPWTRNLGLAAKLYADGGLKAGALGMSLTRANAIFAGADPLDVLRGNKTRAFYQLIADPNDPDTVVIDRHAIDVAIGERLSDLDRNSRYPLNRRGWYERFADAYRTAARRLGVTPSWLQAATWLAQSDQWYGVRIGGLTHI
jgi:hypothetical protein